MERFCRKCGKKLLDDSIFCSFCGEKVIMPIDPISADSSISCENKRTIPQYDTHQRSNHKGSIKNCISKHRIAIILFCICLIIMGVSAYNNNFRINTISDESFFIAKAGDTVWINKEDAKVEISSFSKTLAPGLLRSYDINSPFTFVRSSDETDYVIVFDEFNKAEGKIEAKYLSEAPIKNTHSWAWAEDYYGQEITIAGPVESTAYKPSVNGRPTFINIGHDNRSLKIKQVTAIIWGKDRWKFPKDIEHYLNGKNVRIYGEVYEYEGHPNIRIKNPSQIYIDER